MMQVVFVKRCQLGRPRAKTAYPIQIPQRNLDVGYGPGQLRPDGSRDPRAESRQFDKITLATNGLSGQKTG